jgi:hypothetical protein
MMAYGGPEPRMRCAWERLGSTVGIRRFRMLIQMRLTEDEGFAVHML